jgi:ABC-type multidrug transport system ATPase subunit
VTEPLLEAMDGIGNFVGFLGPNGAGKSTTMCILADSQAATSGSAVISGQDVFWKPVEARRSIGYMPENCSLYPEMRDPSFTFIARVNPASGY